MKTVRIKNTVDSADMLTLKIYHTAMAAGNLLSSSVSQSGIFTGRDLFNGLEFQVEDDVNQFFVENLTLCTNIGSGSLTGNTNAVLFITFDAGSYGSVQIIGTQSTTTSTSATVRQNYSTTPTLTATVTANYPYEFAGWFSNSALTGSALSNSNPLTLSSGSFSSQDEYYVRYQLGSNYY